MFRKLFRFGLCDVLVIGCFALLVILQYRTFADDPGVGWHIATGEWIINNAAVPLLDPFLASAKQRAFVADQWLSDVLLAALYAVGSWPLMYAAVGAVFLVTFCGVTLLSATAVSRSPLAACFATLCALKMSAIHFILRPVVFSFFLFSLVVAIGWLGVQRVRRGERVPARMLWWLVPIFVLWANIHSSFLIGIAFCGIVGIGLVYDTVILRRNLQGLSTLLPFFFWFAVAGVATLANPYGIELHRHALELGSSDYFMSLHQEWLPVNFRETEGKILQVVMLLIISAAVLRSTWAFSWGFTEFFVIAGGLHLALESVRLLPYFALATAPLVAQALASISDHDYWTSLSRAGKFRDFFSALNSRERSTMLGGVALAAIVALMFVGATTPRPLVPLTAEYGPSRDKFPYEAIAELKKAPGIDKVVVNDPAWGGFITMYGEPGVKAVIDDRNTLLGEVEYKAYLDRLRVGGDWQGLLSEYKATHVLLPAKSALAVYLRDTQALPVLYQDSVARLFVVDSE